MFYELLAGLPVSDRKEMGLLHGEDFFYLNQVSDCGLQLNVLIQRLTFNVWIPSSGLVHSSRIELTSCFDANIVLLR